MRLNLEYLHLTIVLIVTFTLVSSDDKLRLNQNDQKVCNDKSKYQMPSEGPFLELPPAASHVLATFSGLKEWAKNLNKYETPLAIRFTHYIDVMNWNCAAIYSSNWKDALTGGEPIMHSPQSITVKGESISLHSSDVILNCMVNTWATVVHDWMPEHASSILKYLQDFKYADIQSGFDDNVEECFNLEDMKSNRIDCLLAVANTSCFAPSVVGSIVGRQVHEHAMNDGWNMHGQLNSDGSKCNANCRRYQDPTVNSKPGWVEFEKQVKKNKKRRIRWAPMLEDNEKGYFTRQEHVTPHIGITGKTALLSKKDFESRSLSSPKYKYLRESKKVINRMKNLNDEDKMLIEFFDDKIALAFALIGTIAQKPDVTFEMVLNYVVGFTSVEYDGILVAWKEKVRHNLIRPTTWIQRNWANKAITTWAGPLAGVKSIKGKEFETWVRVMPHSEYISGSACLCQGLLDFTSDWLQNNLGTNNTSVSVSFTKHSSKTEPGLVPNTNLTIELKGLVELRDACGESRLNGGMHFEKSVYDAYGLCKGIGSIGAQQALNLTSD